MASSYRKIHQVSKYTYIHQVIRVLMKLYLYSFIQRSKIECVGGDWKYKMMMLFVPVSPPRSVRAHSLLQTIPCPLSSLLVTAPERFQPAKIFPFSSQTTQSECRDLLDEIRRIHRERPPAIFKDGRRSCTATCQIVREDVAIVDVRMLWSLVRLLFGHCMPGGRHSRLQACSSGLTTTVRFVRCRQPSRQQPLCSQQPRVG